MFDHLMFPVAVGTIVFLAMMLMFTVGYRACG